MGNYLNQGLIESVNEWQVLRDSVYACITRVTTKPTTKILKTRFRILHDSLRTEFTRLALSQPRSFADVLLVKEKDFPIDGTRNWHRQVTDAEPFFRALDSVAHRVTET